MQDLIPTLAIWALPVIFAITLHEAAHGYVARHFGDPTAYLAGRISLNPLRHVDPVGTLLVPGAILIVAKLFGGAPVLFGWAKPVPVDFARLRRPKQDMLWVAAAGPGANLVMAMAWALAFSLVAAFPQTGYTLPLLKMADAGMDINAVLLFLNLIPIPPLDGGRIAVSLLPHRLAWRFARIEPFGFPILLLLLFSGVLGSLLLPLIALFRFALGVLFHL
ncbi:MAG TPA: site-2 protease family protein [Rhodocyclaceae bacterium]|nr:MAG: site-2 protease family protein [Betaproteobacteria bacterium CG2_30_68_42]PIV72380.1 MAG: site-2 protease family protein [Rhodocyclales bacterium CG17_big_fil_post_rev_8_21_14_2_50_68_7]PIX74443.1 MAG: site-2 protease family protein [Rhodocyclales bacterium CG_4_10_14_3_um_filter_68_10]PJA57576.1 MAG: site-2 protease family protein [Rhodocyclales bacterium CG_4_9_14_3_um_filter_68_10]HCX33893.1 site-2 protease family protein [Rhodocyclaceae bacterium]